jgi:hypothetical protein
VVQLRLHVTREALVTGFNVLTERGDDAESLFGSEGRGSMRASTSGGQVPLLQGRPRTDEYMTQLGREAGRADRAGRGIAVVCCGPRPMVKEVGRQVLMRAPGAACPHENPAAGCTQGSRGVGREGAESPNGARDKTEGFTRRSLPMRVSGLDSRKAEIRLG